MLSTPLNETSGTSAEHSKRRSLFRGLLVLGLGALCGILVALSVPPFGFWPLAWLGFAGLAHLLPGRSAAQRTLLGLGAGLGQYVIGLAWVSEFSLPGCLALMILGSLFVAAALVAVPSGGIGSIIIGLPASLLLSDWLRARFPLGGFPLGGTSLGQSRSPLVPVVRLGGGLLLTGETVLVGVAIALLFRFALAWRHWPSTASGPTGWPGGGDALRLLAVSGFVIALPLAGWLSPSGEGGGLPKLRAALVQGGGERGTRAIHSDPQLVFERHMAAADSITGAVDLVVMPEGILQTDQVFNESADSGRVAALAQRLGSTVIVGVEQDVGTTHYLNEVAAWSPSGEVDAVYLKNHLVPFGEYVPWRSLISKVFNVSDVPLDAIAGHGPGYLKTPAAPLGVMISYEVFFDERARGGVIKGGQLLVVPTNTASYRSSQVPAQELAAARLRAWETGRWVLQVTPTGYSAVIAPSGRVVQRSTLGRREVLEAVVHRETGHTLYVDLGDSPFAVGAVLLLLGSVAIARSGSSSVVHPPRKQRIQ